MEKTKIILRHFSLSEFDSPDLKGSGAYMQVKLLLMLDEAREQAGIPFKINSGYRTQAYHNELTRRGYHTAKNSPHLIGAAADIAYNNTLQLSFIVEACIKAGFTCIGIGKNFVHVDTRRFRSVWFYPDTPQSTIHKYRSILSD